LERFLCKLGWKLRDKDKDHVSRKMDECRKEAGPWAAKGCPSKDQDEDGINDEDDDCPEIAGTKELNGCPDKDKDGIKDSEDACPDVAGLEEFKGCPDTDGDGIEDSKDDCPEVAGIAAFNGCPDTDEDGLMDSEDDCPEIAGPKDNKGCPIIKNDNDKDGVLNDDDECPETFGTAANNGCPELEKEVEEALDIAFKNLEFETSKAIIKTSSYVSLNNLAQIMKDHPTYGILVEGHTDSVGSEESNLSLSEKRANAVKTALVNKGVEGSRIVTKGYGESQPTDTNDTAAGRQNNRRVELTITFE